MRALVSVALLLAAASASAERTITHYAVANGYGAAAVKLDDGRIASFLPRIYATLDEGIFTPQLAYDAYFGAVTSSSSRWLTAVPPHAARALPDTNVLEIVQRDGDLLVTTRVFSPMALSRPAVVAVVTVENTGAATLTSVSFPSLHNFRLGATGPDFNDGEQASYDPARRAFVETGARGALVARALAAPSGYTVTPDDPYPYVQDGQPLPTRASSDGPRDNVVHGFAFAPDDGALSPGETYDFGVAFAFVEDAGALAAVHADLDAWIGQRAPLDLLQVEVDLAQAYVASATAPSGLSQDERALYGHSLALLRAAQVREPGLGTPRRRPRGQIPASLPPGIWNITWLRDSAYAIEGLLDAGRLDEAALALRFFLDGDAGEYGCYLRNPDEDHGTCDAGEAPVDYLLTVTRYYGGGREESDWNAGGPNVEYDGFGLFLHAYARVLEGSAVLDDAIPAVKAGVADVLLDLVDPATGLLYEDSSIWETHWTPDAPSGTQGRRTFAYTSATASAGLRAFADALQARGDPAAAAYRATADAIASAMRQHLVTPSGALAASLEEVQGQAFLDAAVVEAFNKDVLQPDGPVAAATLQAFQALRAQASDGYFRNDEGGEYDTHEWIVVDLWLARAFRRAGQAAEADRLLAHVTDVGVDNLGHIPELLHSADGAAHGAIPMMGFGAGAYLSALADRARDRAVAPVEDGGLAAPDGGVDAGAPLDGGASADDGGRVDDAGVGLDDAGASGPDAGPAGRDGGASGADAGEPDGGPLRGEPACGCAATTTSPPALLAALALLVVVPLRRRR